MQNSTLRHYSTQFIIQYKYYIVPLVLIAITSGFIEVSIGYKIKEIIDAITFSNVENLNVLLMLFCFYTLMHHGIYFLNRVLDVKYKPSILEKTITDIYIKTTNHSLYWFDSHLAGEISSKISDFQDSISSIITNFFQLLSVLSTVLISIVFLAYINILPALTIFLFSLIYIPLIYFLFKKQMHTQEKYVEAKQQTTGIINDSITNIFGIKTIGSMVYELSQKILPSIKKWRGLEKRIRFIEAYYIDTTDTAMVITMSATQIFLLAHLYKSGTITAGDFAFISLVTLKIHQQLDQFIQNLLFNINPNIALVKSSYSFVNNIIDVTDKKNAYSLKGVKGHIEYKNIFFSYGNSTKKVLHNLSLNIVPGERIGIVGASGAGKTTIIKCLLRYFDVSSGQILIDGNNIKDITQASLRESISLIPQDITMFHRSIKDNLLLAKPNATDDELIAACKQARIHQDIYTMPHQYHTIIGERGIKLSGGQRQRIAIARAILKNTPILILDEATSSLDSPTEKLIQESISDVLKTTQATVIAIAHRLSTLKTMNKIFVLNQGTIVETGTHMELSSKNGHYRKLWELQAT